MEIFRKISFKKDAKREEIKKIYSEITSGINDKALTMEVIKKKIEDAGKLIMDLEKDLSMK